MLGATALLAALIAGLALPAAFGNADDDDEDDDAPDDWSATDSRGDGDEQKASPGQDSADGADGTHDAPDTDDARGDSPGEQADADRRSGAIPVVGSPPPFPEPVVGSAPPFAAETPAPLPDSPEGPADPAPGDAEADLALHDGGAGHTASAPAEGLDPGGRDGDDTLDGAESADRLFGGFGDDLLRGGAGDDTLLGGDGNEPLTAVPADGEAPRDGEDVLDGGGGDDMLFLGDADSGTGGSGADRFLVGPGPVAFDQGGDGAAPTIEDFDPEEDALVVVWNDYGGGAPPVLSLSHDPDDPGLARLLGDGEVLAEIRGAEGLTPEAIFLRAASSL